MFQGRYGDFGNEFPERKFATRKTNFFSTILLFHLPLQRLLSSLWGIVRREQCKKDGIQATGGPMHVFTGCKIPFFVYE
jgi:hypothetical protein